MSLLTRLKAVERQTGNTERIIIVTEPEPERFSVKIKGGTRKTRPPNAANLTINQLAAYITKYYDPRNQIDMSALSENRLRQLAGGRV